MNALVKISTITAMIAELATKNPNYDYDFEINSTLDSCIDCFKLLIESEQKCPAPPRVPHENQITLTQDQLETELGEAYRQGKKDGIEENHLTPPETEVEEDDEDKCDCCGEDANAGLIDGKFVCITCREDCCDDEEDDLEPCGCNTKMDIRGRCDPVRSARQFSNCPARFDTAYFHINNDFEKYNDIEASFTRKDRHTKYFQYCREEPFFLTDEPELEDEILYLIEQDEENKEEFCCVRCDGFIPYADEDNGKWCDEEERMVCYSCKDDCYCAECDEYFPDEDELDYLDCDNERTEKFCCDCIAPKKCEALEEEINGYFGDMENDKDKLEMLEEIKNVISKYYKK